MVAAKLVRNPLPILSRVIEVEHGRDGINAYAVEMKLVDPHMRAADEKRAYLGSPIVEDRSVPIWMVAAFWVAVFVEGFSVELGEPMGIKRKVGRYPIEDDADAVTVKGVYKHLEFVWRTKARCWRKIPSDLIAP